MCISTFFYHSNIQCVPIIKSHAKYSLYVRSRLCACAHARKCVCVCMHAWRKRETYTHYDWNARNALVFESTGSHTHAAPAVLPAVTSGAACPTAEEHFRLNRTALAGEGGGGGQEPGARAILWEQADVSLSFTESTPVFVYVSEISVECLHLVFVYVCGSKNRIWEWEVTGKECQWRVTLLCRNVFGSVLFMYFKGVHILILLIWRRQRPWRLGTLLLNAKTNV